jgi:hypothetical protein
MLLVIASNLLELIVAGEIRIQKRERRRAESASLRTEKAADLKRVQRTMLHENMHKCKCAGVT